jgi:hypothetical protein
MNFQTDDDYYNLQLAHFLLETKNLNKSNEYFRKISKKNLKDKDIISNYVISFILDDEKYQSVYNKNKKEIESHQYFKMLKNNLAQSSKKEKEDE